MPPSIHGKSSPHQLSSVREDLEEDFNFGSIEVVEEVEDDGEIYDRIFCLPPQKRRLDEHLVSLLLEEEEEDEEEEKTQHEGIEIAESLPSSILDSLMYGCVGCAPCAGEFNAGSGILKKPTRGVGSDHVISGRSVSFSSLEIKEFGMTLGDHPNAASGPPVMLDAKPIFERTYSLDEYEQMRSPRRKRRQLKLSCRDRKGILENQKGFTSEEINRAWAEATRIRQQRHETLRRGLLLMTMDDVWESAQRKCKRAAETVGLA